MELAVFALASTTPDAPMAENSLMVMREGDAIYWQGEVIGRIDIMKHMARSVTSPRFSMITDRGCEEFGNDDATKNSFMFRGQRLTVVVRLTAISYDTTTRKLTV